MSDDLKPLLEAMNKVMEAASHVTKNGWNDFHKYKYATEEDVLAVVRPAMVEHGLMLLPSLHGQPRLDEHGNTHVEIAYTLVHKSGVKWPEPIIVPGCGNDRAKNGSVGDKGTYKALTGANKYLLFKLFQIATGDDPEHTSAADKASEKDAKPKEPAPEMSETQRLAQFMPKYLEKIAAAKTLDEIESIQSKNGLALKLAKERPALKRQIEDATKKRIDEVAGFSERADREIGSLEDGLTPQNTPF